MIKNLVLQNKVSNRVLLNTRLYQLRKIGLLKNTDLSNFVKKIVFISAIFTNLIKDLLTKLLYLITIYFIIDKITKYNPSIFINSYIFLALFGAIINSKILKTSKSKYHNVILLNMDCKSFTISDVFSSIVFGTIFQFITFIIFNSYLKLSFSTIILLTIFYMTIKIVGEGFNILYYKKTNKTFLTNTVLYFTVLGLIFLSLILTSVFKVYISNQILIYSVIILSVLSIFSIVYIFSIDNYKHIYKRVMNLGSYSDGTQLSREEVYSINKEYATYVKYNKNPYKYFNNIFVKRHSKILLKPIVRETILISILALILIIFMFNNNEVMGEVRKYLPEYFNVLFLIIHILNKSYMVTESMFTNCDRSMLTYDFYKEKEVINNIFKERLKSLIKINCLPIIAISVFVTTILIICGYKLNIELFLIPFMFICLSAFFTTYHLMMYYLLQPYDKDSNVKDLKAQILNMIITFILLFMIKFKIKLFILEMIIIPISLIYIGISIYLVRKKATNTFKIKH